eukprot:2090176-Alexandrium_andersonii.AAC.1
MVPIKPITSADQAFAQAGRVKCVVINSRMGFAIKLFSVYGWTDGDAQHKQRAKTTELLHA